MRGLSVPQVTLSSRLYRRAGQCQEYVLPKLGRSVGALDPEKQYAVTHLSYLRMVATHSEE